MNNFAIILATMGRATLPEAVESVLMQTYKDWTLIISYDIHHAFQRFSPLFQDKRIMHISPGNLQLSNDSGAAARNYAIQFVPQDCKWITYLDCDDTWHTDRLERFNHFIRIHEDDPSFELFHSFGDLWKFKHRSPRSSRKEPKRVGIVDNVTCGGMVHTLEVFKKTPGWNGKNVEDHDLELYKQMLQHCEDDVLEESTFNFYWR
jgi:glycosyltransferase involved in cell wall biosynthesis